MNNFFSKLEEEITFQEDIYFDEVKIQESILDEIRKKIGVSENKGFAFEEIIYDFFEYMSIPLIKTPKTRDGGIDGFVNFNIEFLGEINLGLQIKYSLIDSTDIDSFLTALKNAELQLGIVVCKDSRNLSKYELNSKIKSILLSRGISLKEKLLNEKININPVFVLRLNEIIRIISLQIRAFIKSVYKK